MQIIVNSHYGHHQCWQPWVEFFRTAWPDCPYDTVLVSDKCYDHPADFDMKWSFDEDRGWCANLLNYLEHIDDACVFLTVDDFWFHKPFNQEIMIATILAFVPNIEAYHMTEIACLCLGPCPGPTQEPEGLIGERLPGTDYRICAGPSFWNVAYLKELLRRIMASPDGPRATAWDFEITGTIVSNGMPGTILACKTDVMPFLHSAMRRGKWHPPTLEVARQRGIHVDTSGGEFLKEGEY